MNDKLTPLVKYIMTELACEELVARKLEIVVFNYCAAGFDGLLLIKTLRRLNDDGKSKLLKNLGFEISPPPKTPPKPRHKKRTNWRKRSALNKRRGKQRKHNA